LPPACCITFGTASVAPPPPNPPSIPPAIPARAEQTDPHIDKNPLRTVAMPLGTAKAHKLPHELISPPILPFRHVYGIPQQHVKAHIPDMGYNNIMSYLKFCFLLHYIQRSMISFTQPLNEFSIVYPRLNEPNKAPMPPNIIPMLPNTIPAIFYHLIYKLKEISDIQMAKP
jgi:hypothetical protein